MINWFCFCNRQLKDRALLCKIESVICTKIRWSEIIKNERRYFIYIKWLFTQQHLLYWPSSITKKDCSPNNTFYWPNSIITKNDCSPNNTFYWPSSITKNDCSPYHTFYWPSNITKNDCSPNHTFYWPSNITKNDCGRYREEKVPTLSSLILVPFALESWKL